MCIGDTKCQSIKELEAATCFEIQCEQCRFGSVKLSKLGGLWFCEQCILGALQALEHTY